MRITDGKRIVDVQILQSYLGFFLDDDDCASDILKPDVLSYSAEKDAYIVKHNLDLLISILRETIQEVNAKNAKKQCGPESFLFFVIFVEEIEQ